MTWKREENDTKTHRDAIAASIMWLELQFEIFAFSDGGPHYCTHVTRVCQ